MKGRGHAAGRTGLCLCALVLGVATAAPAAEEPGLSPKRDQRATACAELQFDVEQLNQRIQGVEARLKDASTARKTADQARMEAERRLAASVQELERLRAEVILLKDSRLALETRLEQTDRQQRSDIPSLQRGVERPPSAGREAGTTTLEEARRQAAAAAESLQNALTGVQSDQDPAARQALWDATRDLHSWQLRAARLSGARTVYRIAPGDSLALIARRFYGDSGRRLEILRANRLVLSNPSLLTPGITLVIP